MANLVSPSQLVEQAKANARLSAELVKQNPVPSTSVPIAGTAPTGVVANTPSRVGGAA